MATLLSGQALSKAYGARPLFNDITFGISDGERMGLIGPNGSGKSTLLKILAGKEMPDRGTISRRSGIRMELIAQDDVFPADSTVESVLEAALADLPLEDYERTAELYRMLESLGFADPQQAVDQLSGGWRKRLSLARALIRRPDLLLLDEPTNHLDLEGIYWLEKVLSGAQFAFLAISHDRVFLEKVTNRVVELNPAYPDGYLRVEGTYSDLLEKKEAFLATQAHQQVALQNRVKREVDWLRRMPQARATKAQYRIDAAHKLIGELGDVKQRNQSGRSADLEFTSSGRGTKELLVAKGIGKSINDRWLFTDLEIQLIPGTRLGLLGPNGSGKSSLIRILTEQWQPDAGTVSRAHNLRIVLFDQNREELDPRLSLRRSLAPGGDTVEFQGSSMHVAAWAKRFLFSSADLEKPIALMSGGEKARVMLARLMLRPADVLILDEPTNDLDIDTLEVLEESLLEFPGALVLVTHDRYLLARVSSEILALDGKGGANRFADVDQWEIARDERLAADRLAQKPQPTSNRPAGTTAPQRLSNSERRELGQMEGKIADAEQKLEDLDAAMMTPEVAANPALLAETWEQRERAKEAVDQLYLRWEELEAKA